MPRALRFAFALSIFVLSTLGAGCECSPPPADRSCETQRDCRGDQLCIDGRCTAAVDGSVRADAAAIDSGPPRAITSVRIEPATSELASIDGSRPMETFAAILSYDDGTEGPASGPSFAIDTVSLGDLDEASGTFEANGTIGGTASITVTVPSPSGSLTASATLVVRLERSIRGDGVTDDDLARFGTATPVDDTARDAALVYPLDGVVMPQNVYPADVQWTRAAGGDLFRVTLRKPSVSVVAHLGYDPSMHWLVDEPAWRAVAQTEPDAPAMLTVDRLEAATGELVRGTPITITFARAALTGSVYYWDIARGRIIRIDDGTAARNEFMPTPPVAPADGSRCVGCHTISNSGRYMAGRLGGGENSGTVFDLTTDLTGDPPPTVFPVGALNWWFSSWSPDDTRMVVSIADPAALRFYDPFAGVQVPVEGPLPTNATQPSWSPDGTRIAFVSNPRVPNPDSPTGFSSSWGGDFSYGEIAILPVIGPDSVGPATVIHTGSSLAGGTPPGNADSYPTWSPDSQQIAFAHGNGARSEWGPSVVPTPRAPNYSALYIMNPDGTGVTRLDHASVGSESYQPRFSPFQQGGYYWLSFLSRRDYGNAVEGSVGAHRQQIWVAAIRAGASTGVDSSAVPYWLPGQSPSSMNISAFWAPRACRPDGEGCSVGTECCGGDCRPPAGGGAPVCSPPPPERCRRSGETCSTTADCCPEMGLTCLGNVCVAGPG